MKKFIFLFVLLAVSSQSSAYEEIKGAFGLQLGGLFIPQHMATAQGSMTSGESIYYFKPDPGYHAFSEYYVKITPQTNHIYEIVAEHEYETGLACENEQETLAGLLKKKYGRIDKNDFMYTFYSINQHPRSIALSCSIFENRLRITYSDENVEKQARTETVDSLSKEGGDSGL